MFVYLLTYSTIIAYLCKLLVEIVIILLTTEQNNPLQTASALGTHRTLRTRLALPRRSGRKKDRYILSYWPAFTSGSRSHQSTCSGVLVANCLALPLDFLLDGLYEPTMAGLSSSTALSLFLLQDLVDRFDLVDIQP